MKASRSELHKVQLAVMQDQCNGWIKKKECDERIMVLMAKTTVNGKKKDKRKKEKKERRQGKKAWWVRCRQSERLPAEGKQSRIGETGSKKSPPKGDSLYTFAQTNLAGTQPKTRCEMKEFLVGGGSGKIEMGHHKGDIGGK